MYYKLEGHTPVPIKNLMELLEAFESLYNDFYKVNWHPTEQMPIEVIRWISVTPFLLVCYRKALEELNNDAASRT